MTTVGECEGGRATGRRSPECCGKEETGTGSLQTVIRKRRIGTPTVTSVGGETVSLGPFRGVGRGWAKDSTSGTV